MHLVVVVRITHRQHYYLTLRFTTVTSELAFVWYQCNDITATVEGKTGQILDTLKRNGKVLCFLVHAENTRNLGKGKVHPRTGHEDTEGE